MSETSSQDFHQRLDNTAVIKLLTGCASALADNKILSAHDAEDLRIALSGLQSEFHDKPLLLSLEQQNNEFLTMLYARYGRLGFCQNVFRYTAYLALRESAQALSALGDAVLGKAQVLFNRPFYIHIGDVCERRTLFSSVLVELAETIDQTSRTLEQAGSLLGVLFPSSLSNGSQEDQAIDQRIAKEVGFDDVAHDALGFCREETARALIVGAFSGFTSTIKDFIEQLRHNKLRDDTASTVILCESLATDVQLINAFSFPRTMDLAAWEVRRRSFLRAIRSLNSHVNALSAQFKDSLAKVGDIQAAGRTAVPEDVLRGMSTSMIKDGTAPLKAVAAACALVRYCEQHQVPAEKILPAELAKIDPNLSIACLDILKTEDRRPLEGDIKQRNLERQQTLMKSFHAKLTQAGILIVSCLFIFTGCGVKMAPKSDLIDYRPAVRYHTLRPVPDYIKKAQEKEAAKESTADREKTDEQ